MLFNSEEFALFLPIVFAIYWLLPARYRWGVLLVASYWFYMSWEPKYVLIILFTTVVSYMAGLLIDKVHKQVTKKKILVVACSLCLLVLFFFKYFNFVSENIAKICSFFSLPVSPLMLKFLLPVGISFYTFQALSYVIDVYRGRVAAEKHFGKYATFVSFFPQLVAGPIERTDNLLPQIKKESIFDYKLGTYGLKLMAWGYFKKMVIADTISIYIGQVFDNPKAFTGSALFVASLFFTVQIYCDFSGSSDIAIGVAKLFGINLMENFKSPYFSQSIHEFWSRWHISLSTWFRDYVYIPLGGNRKGQFRTNLNLLITFLVSGLWHGANWTFIIWGAIHGGAQVFEKMLFPNKKRSTNGVVGCLRVLVVFSFCSLAWILFASNSVDDAIYFMLHMFDGILSPISFFYGVFDNLGLAKSVFLSLVVSVLIMTWYDYASMKCDVIEVISSLNVVVRWLIYIMFTLWIIFNIPQVSATEFIYFQF